MSSTPDLERVGQTATEASVTVDVDNQNAVAFARNADIDGDVSLQQVLNGLTAYEELLDTEFAACDVSAKDCVRLVVTTYRSRLLGSQRLYPWRDFNIFRAYSLHERDLKRQRPRMSVLISELNHWLREEVSYESLTAAILRFIATGAVSQMVPPGLIVMILQVVFENSADPMGLALPESKSTIFLATSSAMILAEEFTSRDGQAKLCG